LLSYKVHRPIWAQHCHFPVLLSGFRFLEPSFVFTFLGICFLLLPVLLLLIFVPGYGFSFSYATLTIAIGVVVNSVLLASLQVLSATAGLATPAVVGYLRSKRGYHFKGESVQTVFFFQVEVQKVDLVWYLLNWGAIFLH
jgi:hypothetical protein